MRVLLVDNDESAAVQVREVLWACRYDVTHAGHLDAALAGLSAEPADLLLAALHLPDAQGVEVVRRVRAVAPRLPLIILAGAYDDALALDAIRCGAQDFLPKGELDQRLVDRAVRYAVERARLEAALQEAEGRLRVIQEQAPVLICRLTRDGDVSALNPGFEAMTGWPAAEWLGRPFGALLHPEDRAAALGLVQRTLGAEVVAPLDVRMLARDGGVVISSFTAVPVMTQGQVTDVIGIARDVTELRQLVARERETARTDHLTGLANRRACEEAISREVARATRENASVTFALFDLDHFKDANDTYGHHVGDAVLRAIAGILKAATRATDVAGRWGGEELLAVLPRTDLAGARVFAERIRAGAAALDGLPCRVTVSAGVAEWTRGQDVAVVLARADAKLYVAKRAGRNRVC